MKKKKIIILLSLATTISVTVSAVSLVSLYNQSSEKPEKVYYWVSFDTDGGSPIPSISVEKGSKIKKPTDPTKTGYSVDSWLKGNDLWNFSKDTVLSNITLTTKWKTVQYHISYDLDGGTPVGEYIPSYTIESNFELPTPIKNGFVFSGWFSVDEKRIDRINPGMVGNLSLHATWTNAVYVASTDETKGNVRLLKDETRENYFMVKNDPVNNLYHLFLGWYDENNNLLSEDATYSFEASKDKVTYIYSKYCDQEQEDLWNKEHGVVPTLNSENNTITYGLYPQSVVTDDSVIDSIEEVDKTVVGGYYYYNHEYYVKSTARTFIDEDQTQFDFLFDNGMEIVENQEYWFKVEPISWKVLENTSGKKLVVSEKLLESGKYHLNGAERIIDERTIQPNNYAYSSMRKYLNENFYESAFVFNKDYVSPTVVDNSPSSTIDSTNRYACEDTMDKVFCLSYSDYQNEEYNLNTLLQRQCKTTDYLRCRNVKVSESFNGYYWTRSPYNDDPAQATRINMNGSLNMDFVGYSRSSIRPALSIATSD